MSNTLADRRPKRSRARASAAGFTLVEVLVVITIITLIMGLIGPRVLNYLTQSKAKASKIQIESFASALDLYFLDAGRYPTTSEGLGSLLEPPGSTIGWNGPYLRGNAVPDVDCNVFQRWNNAIEGLHLAIEKPVIVHSGPQTVAR